MATLMELMKRAKELGIRRYSVMNREELLKVLEEAEKEAYYKSIHWDQCLDEQRKQRIIDEHTYNAKAMANVIRQLICKYCQHEDFTVDGELQICRYCGVIREEVSIEGDYETHRVRHK